MGVQGSNKVHTRDNKVQIDREKKVFPLHHVVVL